MSQLLSLGAVNKHTGEYVYPKIANKLDDYMCPECNNDLILCQGKVRAFHFRHKVEKEKPCCHYNSPSETQIHKDAKILLKTLIEKKVAISFIRYCSCCKKGEEIDIPELDERGTIQLEYRFEFNGSKVADIAYLYDDETLCLFEICHTHKTCNEDRPEPWFEIDAKTLISIANDNSVSCIQIPCMRIAKCDSCLDEENKNLIKYNIEKYVRMKLGQTYPVTQFDSDGRIKHLRLDFHTETNKDFIKNKRLIELFNDDYNDYKVVFHSWKGHGYAFIVAKKSYERLKHKYYDIGNYDNNGHLEKLPILKTIWSQGDKGTVQMIIEIIKQCQQLDMIKLSKINQLKEQISSFTPRKSTSVDSDDDADVMRSMRYEKQGRKHILSLCNELELVENDIEYKLGNNVVEIEQPVTHTKVRNSLVNNKTFYKGKWKSGIPLNMLILWYHSDNDILDSL